MENIIHEFGVDPVLLGAQIINFLIVLFILKKFLYKPIFETLSKRKEAIEKGFANAEEARLLLDKAQLKEKEVLKEAQIQARKIVENAKKESETLINQARNDAKTETEGMIKSAKETIEDQMRKSQAQLASQTARVAVTFLEKSLLGLFTDKDQKDIMERALQKIKKKSN